MYPSLIPGQNLGSERTSPLPASMNGALYYDSNAGKIMNVVNGISAPAAPIQQAPPDLSGSAFGQSTNGQPGSGVGGAWGFTSDAGPSQADLDAQARAAEDARINTLREGFNTQKQGIFDSINQWGDNTAARYGLDVQDFGNKLKSGQDALNLRGANNEAGRIQGTAGILGMIGRGVKSAGTYLGGRNAGSSSAAGEIARAYGDVGRRQMSSVGNQYAAAEAQRGVDQSTFNDEATLGVDRFKQNMDNEINAQVASAQSALTDLDVAMQNASLPDRIAIDQEKNRIKSELIAKLQTFDQQARDARTNARATDVNQNRGTAQSNLAQGQAPADMFSFTDQAPLEMQNSGPSASGLPIYTNNKRRLA